MPDDGQANKVSDQQTPEAIEARLESLGFTVTRIDGHAPDAIRGAFEAFAENAEGSDSEPMAMVDKLSP